MLPNLSGADVFMVLGTVVLTAGIVFWSHRKQELTKPSHFSATPSEKIKAIKPNWVLQSQGHVRIQAVICHCLGEQVNYTNAEQIRDRIWTGHNSLKQVYGRLSLGRLKITDYHEKSIAEIVLPWQEFLTNHSHEQIHTTISELCFKETGMSQLDYDVLIVFFPKGYTEDWIGLGTLGIKFGGYRRIWMVTDAQGTLLHEFGHNLGLDHATCDLFATTSREYGDPTSFMGDTKNVMIPGNFVGLNAPHLVLLNWIVPKKVTMNEMYRLTPFDQIFEPDHLNFSSGAEATLVWSDGSSKYYASLNRYQGMYQIAIYLQTEEHYYQTELITLLKPNEKYVLGLVTISYVDVENGTGVVLIAKDKKITPVVPVATNHVPWEEITSTWDHIVGAATGQTFAALKLEA